jgi:Caspase domain
MGEKRIALVVGNAAYRHATALLNPVDDAVQMAAALDRLNFRVKLACDCDINAFQNELRSFSDRLKEKPDVGLFYYSGHALQFDGDNYLIPIDARLEEPKDLARLAFKVSPQLLAMRVAARVSFVFLEACQDDPFHLDQTGPNARTKKVILRQPGLVEFAGPRLHEALIAFAAEQGYTAVDGDEGDLSPFTKALVQHIETPGLEIKEMIHRVKQAVSKATKGKQRPWSNDVLTSEFYFKSQTRLDVPNQSPAPVRIEERDGKIAQVIDRDSSLYAEERNFNDWRELIIDHLRELASGDFREGTNHSRARDRLVGLEKLLAGEIADVKDRQFRIGYEIERLDGLLTAYKFGGDDMPTLHAAVLADLERLHVALKMGISKLERWSEFCRLAADDPFREGDADTATVGDALGKIADKMEQVPKYFDPKLPISFRFLAEAMRDPAGATKAVVYGAVKSAENLFSFLGQRALGIATSAADTLEKQVSKAVATSLLLALGSAALQVSGALPTGWVWLKPLLDALAKGG